MKRYILTLTCGLMALTSFAQSMLMVETETGNREFIYGNTIEISFWGQPQGDEQNGDLTITPTEVKGTSMSFVMKVSNKKCIPQCGFYLSEQEGEWNAQEVINVKDPIVAYQQDQKYRHCFSLTDVNFGNEEKYGMTITELSPHTTYYIKPYVIVSTDTIFGSEKSFTTQWTLSSLAALGVFGDWYADAETLSLILPTETAWQALCSKYQYYLGEEPTPSVKKMLTTEWARHLTPAEANLMKAHSVAHYDDCEEGDVYVVDKVCDDMMPNLIKASGDFNLNNPNPDYTRSCMVEKVTCDASYGISGNQYWKTEAYNASVNPQVGYDFPFPLLPNRIYNVSVTIASNTEDIEDTRPNRFNVTTYRKGVSKGQKISNPQTIEGGAEYVFVYGGLLLETFTFQLDTHNDTYSDVLQLSANVASRQKTEYSRTIRIAKITVSPVVEDAVPGDVDMDGTLDNDDVQTVATAVILNDEAPEEESGEKPATDFTGDGQTRIDDLVALVNYIKTGQFNPSSAKERARYAAAAAPAFTTQKNFCITAGENATMSVDMSGMTTYTALSFDIKVPEGVRVAIDDNGVPQVALGNATASTHQLKAAMQEDGKTISVACYADDNACFTKSDGSIITVALTTGYDMMPNENAQIVLANCMVTKPSLSSVMMDDYPINAGIINGVEALDATDVESLPAAYYTLDGIQLSAPQKGFNLVKMSNAQIKKVWVK